MNELTKHSYGDIIDTILTLEGQKKRIKELQNKEVFRNSQLCDSLQRGKKPSNVECNHVKHTLDRNLARL
jgi:hypothetical protein